MRFKVTLKNQLTGVTVEREIDSSYDATSVVEREAKQTMSLPGAWDAIKCVRIDSPARTFADDVADMVEAHAEGLHAEDPREFCPECER